jgi:MoaA/NifB/PqqE/SkfB family radical SAM enzyme
MDTFTNPRSVSLDVSTACQLKCPACPTAKGIIAKNIGAGFLKFEDFKRFIQANPSIANIELSNWGEIFLNPDFENMLKFAYHHNVALSANNGVNLNRITAGVLEGLVKYKFRSLSCSIDGASQEVYSVYRVKGSFDQVISHIKMINAFKQKYRSPYPALRWQYVAFGHNEHEINKAREMAKELNMSFYLKLSWDNLYGTAFSPIKNRELIKKETGLGVADRQEYEEKYRTNFVAATCHQLWLAPQINYDGKLLGCCINHWGDFGNVFEEGLERCLNSQKMKDAKDIVLGKKDARKDVPCTNCQIYHSMRKNKNWVKIENIKDVYVKKKGVNILIHKVKHLVVRSFITGLVKIFNKSNNQ